MPSQISRPPFRPSGTVPRKRYTVQLPPNESPSAVWTRGKAPAQQAPFKPAGAQEFSYTPRYDTVPTGTKQIPSQVKETPLFIPPGRQDFSYTPRYDTVPNGTRQIYTSPQNTLTPRIHKAKEVTASPKEDAHTAEPASGSDQSSSPERLCKDSYIAVLEKDPAPLALLPNGADGLFRDRSPFHSGIGLQDSHATEGTHSPVSEQGTHQQQTADDQYSPSRSAPSLSPKEMPSSVPEKSQFEFSEHKSLPSTGQPPIPPRDKQSGNTANRKKTNNTHHPWYHIMGSIYPSIY